MLVQLLSPITGSIDGIELPPRLGFFEAPEREDGSTLPAVADLIEKGHAREADPAELEAAAAEATADGNYDAILLAAEDGDAGAEEGDEDPAPAADPEPKPARGRGAKSQG